MTLTSCLKLSFQGLLSWSYCSYCTPGRMSRKLNTCGSGWSNGWSYSNTSWYNVLLKWRNMSSSSSLTKHKYDYVRQTYFLHRMKLCSYGIIKETELQKNKFSKNFFLLRIECLLFSIRRAKTSTSEFHSHLNESKNPTTFNSYN